MNKQELNRALSHIHASADLKKEVLAMKSKPNPNFRLIAKRAAVCAAVLALLVGAVLFWPNESRSEDGQIVAVPGMLKAYACDIRDVNLDKGELSQYEISNENKIFIAQWNPLINASNFALPLTLQLSEDYFDTAEITFKLYAEYGGFSEKPGNHKNYRKQITVTEKDFWYFGGNTLLDAMTDIGEGKNFYADILVYADGILVGYGVITFSFQGATCYACGLTTVCYPPVEGRFQNISEEYILEQIAEYKGHS